MKFKGIIFDFNGTLFYDTPFHNIAWQRITKEITGKDLDDELRIKMHGKNNKDILYCIQADMSKENNDYYSKYKEKVYRDICLEHPDKLHLLEGAVEFFNYLVKHNIPFTIASASIKDNIDFFVKTFGLDRWFNVDKIVYDDGNHVNKISMFNDAAKNLNVKIEDCIIFEDSKTGIGYAKEVGAGLVVGIGSDFEMLSKYGADFCITDFTEFDSGEYL
ncbi:HAD family hydrolase [Thomasclavelia cocleata]|jgi:beta-phosphoglucomutase-like phosphatase (HAD superfamily)|uniref:HAD family hydrolase n=1 Tax=Thomasclavelia cocleata TaxID=69824 RepID=UPI0024957C7C|nr:HAD family phosphatase [Thomasclavelia cocleata]